MQVGGTVMVASILASPVEARGTPPLTDGKIESTKLERLGLDEAHRMAERVLQIGNGLYTEVEICTENGCVETVHKDDAVGATSSKVRSILVQ
jgi:hypothetical protein